MDDRVEVFVRLAGNPIIRPDMLPQSERDSINGPSLLAAPSWLESPPGRYLLYFAHHNGASIRLAVADHLSGPWRVWASRPLLLSAVPWCQAHIASPDVVADHVNRELRMYFHAPTDRGQRSFAAISTNGVSFEGRPGSIGPPYLRVMQHSSGWLGIAMNGRVYLSPDGLSPFSESGRGPSLQESLPVSGARLRHIAIRAVTDEIEVYYSMIGDAPERIWRCQLRVPAVGNLTWDRHEVVLEPRESWEGADLAQQPSVAGMPHGRVRQLRDPAVFEENGITYLLYSVAGESGIAIARCQSPEA